MTKIVHVANTNVEFEFAQSSLLALDQSLSRHPLCLQLQFLPLLYAQPGDLIAVTAMPSSHYLKVLHEMGWWPEGIANLVPLQAFEPFYQKTCLSWGPSREVSAWAKARCMHYDVPHDWQMVRLVNSKAFSFRYNCLPEAALLNFEQELIHWIQKVPGPKVLKTCFGLSGQGNRLVSQTSLSAEILKFCRREWQQGRPVIGEPWLDRILDFSTQWFIDSNQNIQFIGATRFETDPQGSYQGTLAGPEDLLFASLKGFLQHHRQFVQKALEDIARLGFFGSIGIDALLYRHPQTQAICLYPLVEINGRQTMSFVALRLQQRLCPRQVLRLAFQQDSSSSFSLLPDRLINSQGKEISFRRHLIATILSDY